MHRNCCCCAADLVNIFEVFLPQLLLYPNPSDPLNGDAAALMMRDQSAYDQKVRGLILICTSKHLSILVLRNHVVG